MRQGLKGVHVAWRNVFLLVAAVGGLPCAAAAGAPVSAVRLWKHGLLLVQARGTGVQCRAVWWSQ